MLHLLSGYECRYRYKYVITGVHSPQVRYSTPSLGVLCVYFTQLQTKRTCPKSTFDLLVSRSWSIFSH